MSPQQILIILALTAYAVYKQSVPHPVRGKSRFKLALIYAVVGLAVGGFYLPPNATSWMILLGSLLLSATVGVARGRLSELWTEPGGQIMTRGTPWTVTLFLLLIVAKFAIGTWQYMTHQPGEHGGFGEVLLLIGVMVALQAEIVWRRSLALPGDIGAPSSHDLRSSQATAGAEISQRPNVDAPRATEACAATQAQPMRVSRGL